MKTANPMETLPTTIRVMGLKPNLKGSPLTRSMAWEQMPMPRKKASTVQPRICQFSWVARPAPRTT